MCTCVDVERSFSAYRAVLEEKRHKFESENNEKILVIYVIYCAGYNGRT
jgi:hypothetical protein